MRKTLLSIITLFATILINAQVTNGLVADYNFNTSSAVDGIVPKANGNSGTAYTTDRFGNPGAAAAFSGSTTMNMGSPTKALFTTGLTISAWFKVTDVNNQQAIVSKWAGSVNLDQYIIMISGGKLLMAVGRIGVSASGITGTTTLQPNTWYHVVATWDNSGRHEITLNGVLDVSSVNSNFTSINSSSTTHLRIGSQANDTRFLTGNVDDVKLFDRKLDSTEINSLYNEPNWAVNGLVSKYSFSNNTNDEVNNNDALATTIVFVNDRLGNPNQAIDITTNSHLNLMDNYDGFATGSSGAISYSFWVNFKVVNGSYQMLLMKQADSGCSANDRQYMLRLNANNKLDINAAGTLSPSNNVSYEGSTTLTSGQWYHVVLTYDASIASGSKFKIYLDNAEETLTQTSISGVGIGSGILDGNAHIGIGAYLNSSGSICVNTQRLDAYFDDLYVYNKVLAPAEISDLYNGTVSIEKVNIENKMSIYPNPVTNMLHISTEDNINKLSIYNINGSLIRNYENINNTIDVSSLIKGMYILVVQTDKGITQNKFIKE